MTAPKWKLPILATVLTVLVAACGGGTEEADGGGGGETPAPAECTSTLTVGVAFDIGGLGDKSFNDAANAGLQQAIADGLVCEENVSVNEADSTGSNRDANVEALAQAGFDLVVAVGFAFSEFIAGIAPNYPDTNFMVVDGYSAFVAENANVSDYVFKEQEGSFLVGAAAALECGCDTIGFLGGQTGFLIGKFEAGYTAGAKAVNPDIEVLVEYIGDDTTAFNDPVKGEALSTKMYDDGAEIIYHASGASGAGLFNASVAAGKLAIGVDSDQYLTASAEQQPLILTSMLKRVDVAVYTAIENTLNGTFAGGQLVFGMAESGVDYSTSNPALSSDIAGQLDAYKEQIISGEIVVPEQP